MRGRPLPPFGRFFAVVAFTASLTIGCSTPAESRGTSKAPVLEIHVINVGQGDAILIRCPEGLHELLIDSGELNQRYAQAGTLFKTYLSAIQAASNPIEVVVASHPHSDHIGNMPWVVDTYSIGLYVDDGLPSATATYRTLEEKLTAKAVARRRLNDEAAPDIDFCPLADVRARILRPAGMDYAEDDPNDSSVVLRVDYKATSFLFVGDAEAGEEKLLMDDPATRALLDCDLLKAGHHASETSSRQAFLDAVTPKIVAVSCGKKDAGTNRGFKHPRLRTLKNLLPMAESREGPALEIDAYDSEKLEWTKVKLNTAVYVTSAQGDLVFESDGTTVHKR
jgi:competence protein ComEC